MEIPRIMKEGALAGIRVVDFTWERSGPQTTRILAMFGAEVIRVEWPGAPDSGRRGTARMTPPGVEPGPNTSGDFNNFSCNKLSVILNARDPKGKESLKRLIAVSDLVIENYGSRVMENWGLDYETQRQANPAIIYISMAGFGHSGRWRDYASWGPGNQALGGLTFMGGKPGMPPSGYGESYMDHTAGYYGAMAVLAAFHFRNETGKGQHIDLSQVDVGCTLTGAAILDQTVNGRPTRREGFPTGNRTYWPGYPITNSYRGRHAAPHNVYKCSGGGHWDWCVIACETEAEWQSLVGVMGNPEWARDPKFGTLLGRLMEQEDLDSNIGAWTGSQEKYALVQKLQSVGVPAGPVNGTGDRVERDPQLLHRGTFATQAGHPLLGDRPFESLPMKMSATPWEIWRHAPLLDGDSEYVLQDLCGVDEGEVSGPEPVRTSRSNGDALAADPLPALGGIRVLEVTNENGELCGKLLADLGAEVIKIEPPGGSAARSVGPFLEDSPGPDRSLFFWHYNTNKRGVTLNLDSLDGQRLFKDLARTADVVLESELPGNMAARGLDYARIQEINPRIIYCSFTPYGQGGPYAHYKANDLCLMAAGGQMGVSGYDAADDPDETPVAPSGGNAWHTGNNYAFISILTALYARDRKGDGQHIDVSAQEAVATCTEGAFADYAYMGGERKRQTGRHAGVNPSPQVQIPTGDGKYINCLMPKVGPKEFGLMAEWFEELAGEFNDLASADPSDYAKTMSAVLGLVRRAASKRTADEMMHGGQTRKIPWAVVRAPSEIVEDLHLADRGFFVNVDHPELGKSFTYPGAPYLLQGSPWRINRRAPQVGEDNLAILRDELGLDQGRLTALTEMGVI